MRQLLNMLFVTKPDVYLGLNGENITVRENDKISQFVFLLQLVDFAQEL